MGIFLSSADKPRFLATKGFGEEAAGAEFHNSCAAFPACVCFQYTLHGVHCKGSQWVTMLDVHRPHTHYMGHNGFDNGAGQEEGEGGVAWFWTNALFQLVRRRPPLLISFCPILPGCSWTAALVDIDC